MMNDAKKEEYKMVADEQEKTMAQAIRDVAEEEGLTEEEVAQMVKDFQLGINVEKSKTKNKSKGVSKNKKKMIKKSRKQNRK